MKQDMDKKCERKCTIEELIGNYRKTGGHGLMEKIISRSEGFLYKITRNMAHSLEEEELMQLAYKGLLVAVSRFDPEKNTGFFTYAYYCIKGEILNHIRDNSIIKYPRWIWNLNRMFNRFIRDFKKRQDRYPDLEEISRGMNISPESLDELLKARGSLYGDHSLDRHASAEGLVSMKENIRSREYRSFNLPMEDRILLWDAIDGLKSINKKILILKFFFGFTQQEIGSMVGVSQRHVSRRLNESIDKLRSLMT